MTEVLYRGKHERALLTLESHTSIVEPSEDFIKGVAMCLVGGASDHPGRRRLEEVLGGYFPWCAERLLEQMLLQMEGDCTGTTPCGC